MTFAFPGALSCGPTCASDLRFGPALRTSTSHLRQAPPGQSRISAVLRRQRRPGLILAALPAIPRAPRFAVHWRRPHPDPDKNLPP
jgi:hypothetical protein